MGVIGDEVWLGAAAEVWARGGTETKAEARIHRVVLVHVGWRWGDGLLMSGGLRIARQPGARDCAHRRLGALGKQSSEIGVGADSCTGTTHWDSGLLGARHRARALLFVSLTLQPGALASPSCHVAGHPAAAGGSSSPGGALL